MNLEDRLETLCKELYEKPISDCSEGELFHLLMNLTKELSMVSEHLDGSKKIYYVSAEFLIGKLLSNNLINLGIYDAVKRILEKNGKSLALVEEAEAEPSLGNGGLGRLAACFLDSITTLGIPGEGIGLLYHFGLFRQVFKDHLQTEEKDSWLSGPSWLHKTETVFPVFFGKEQKMVLARLYDLEVTGYTRCVNTLRLFDLEGVDEELVKKGIKFDQKKTNKNLTLFLYPDDSTEAGRKLRIYQQYFMVSAGAQFILHKMHENKRDLHKLYEHVQIQINDTHPTMIIPELIRLLVKEKALPFEEAVEIVTKTCAYTNHTILAEALETWPLAYLEEIVPQLVPIIQELDAKIREQYKNPKVRIIDGKKNVHMAHLDIHYTHSVNGVAALHTEILKTSELKPFYNLYPERFNNKTNGITFRRWLLSCNHDLCDYLVEVIGPGFKRDAMQLEKLKAFQEDEAVLKRLEEIKQKKKRDLADYIQEKQGISIDPESIFDIQTKRLHEYKRQQMNCLYIIHKYLEIKAGKKPKRPVTFLFGAKAAPAYVIAKDIIHLILVLEEIINNDPEVSPYLKVVMVENYNVSYAEKIIPACDISEQISLASKEASGTGNMKFMLNGAPTLGTMDGANVEIVEEVGTENA
ncbi:MAG: glycogen/starch/alpha-glucan family phosphorylase, partial [Lachnospiraceae bacterium]|nr:glycogen/starch/alpha-glucan family phosphorylase [Lachnospiraceae bacterium]